MSRPQEAGPLGNWIIPSFSPFYPFFNKIVKFTGFSASFDTGCTVHNSQLSMPHNPRKA
jgi:hypothetical protein